jgi:hypothetical protein
MVHDRRTIALSAPRKDPVVTHTDPADDNLPTEFDTGLGAPAGALYDQLITLRRNVVNTTRAYRTLATPAS